jgi:hypothetical protein
MDDEVFVSVEYQDDDFVRMRRLALFGRLREANAGQIMLFVFVGAIGALFLAPDWIGRIFASAAGAMIAAMAFLVVWGWIRAAKPMKLPIERAAIEISSNGIVVKHGERYGRLGWRDFDSVSEGIGIFYWAGKITVVVPRRCLRDDQVKTLRALVAAHKGSSGGGTFSPAAEQHDQNRS